MKFVLIGATAAIAAAFATPALAQRVVEDPGYCAQYYPNANCQNYGPNNPVYDPGGYYGGGYYGGGYYGNNWQNGNAYNAYPEPYVQPRLHRHHRTHHG